MRKKHQTVLAKLELPHFIETAYVHSWYCRLFFQVQETVLHKMCCTHSNIWVELFWNSVVNTTKPLISSCVFFWKPKQSTFTFTRHGAGGSNNTTARIKISPSFFACTFGQCYAILPIQWRRRVGMFNWAVLGGRGQVLPFIKYISLGLRL